ncbi:uncharacterized protein MONOS_6744 [Monocercomonoides exilis]|uniref:uncharacterized protein n=1 Tax=Monocercomonoides exilis TaxID=2049356 RepID=UPI003559A03D|nr:hypothetical protein MONOS_6744 [Monocercomonoides exilis]|eukprot:MONOS_6744.1-p1 / transcript=MONOS_6744.1 / gene=MONOS_6744 / organism=Monocercomonoides_exilis_PA203 / gene_product=unspecified product / transcript_product=unspecified product / location=Mono_scaffold00218:38011-43029(+) / protein_length=1586 / sequence_SO=supercontig / SO=protein_coding / is_pseudo=false
MTDALASSGKFINEESIKNTVQKGLWRFQKQIQEYYTNLATKTEFEKLQHSHIVDAQNESQAAIIQFADFIIDSFHSDTISDPESLNKSKGTNTFLTSTEGQEVVKDVRIEEKLLSRQEEIMETLHRVESQNDILKNQLMRRDRLLAEQRALYLKEMARLREQLYQKSLLGDSFIPDSQTLFNPEDWIDKVLQSENNGHQKEDEAEINRLLLEIEKIKTQSNIEKRKLELALKQQKNDATSEKELMEMRWKQKEEELTKENKMLNDAIERDLNENILLKEQLNEAQKDAEGAKEELRRLKSDEANIAEIEREKMLEEMQEKLRLAEVNAADANEEAVREREQREEMEKKENELQQIIQELRNKLEQSEEMTQRREEEMANLKEELKKATHLREGNGESEGKGQANNGTSSDNSEIEEQKKLIEELRKEREREKQEAERKEAELLKRMRAIKAEEEEMEKRKKEYEELKAKEIAARILSAKQKKNEGYDSKQGKVVERDFSSAQNADGLNAENKESEDAIKDRQTMGQLIELTAGVGREQELKRERAMNNWTMLTVKLKGKEMKRRISEGIKYDEDDFGGDSEKDSDKLNEEQNDSQDFDQKLQFGLSPSASSGGRLSLGFSSSSLRMSKSPIKKIPMHRLQKWIVKGTMSTRQKEQEEKLRAVKNMIEAERMRNIQRVLSAACLLVNPEEGSGNSRNVIEKSYALEESGKERRQESKSGKEKEMNETSFNNTFSTTRKKSPLSTSANADADVMKVIKEIRRSEKAREEANEWLNATAGSAVFLESEKDTSNNHLHWRDEDDGDVEVRRLVMVKADDRENGEEKANNQKMEGWTDRMDEDAFDAFEKEDDEDKNAMMLSIKGSKNEEGKDVQSSSQQKTEPLIKLMRTTEQRSQKKRRRKLELTDENKRERVGSHENRAISSRSILFNDDGDIAKEVTYAFSTQKPLNQSASFFNSSSVRLSPPSIRHTSSLTLSPTSPISATATPKSPLSSAVKSSILIPSLPLPSEENKENKQMPNSKDEELSKTLPASLNSPLSSSNMLPSPPHLQLTSSSSSLSFTSPSSFSSLVPSHKTPTTALSTTLFPQLESSELFVQKQQNISPKTVANEEQKQNKEKSAERAKSLPKERKLETSKIERESSKDFEEITKDEKSKGRQKEDKKNEILTETNDGIIRGSKVDKDVFAVIGEDGFIETKEQYIKNIEAEMFEQELNSRRKRAEQKKKESASEEARNALGHSKNKNKELNDKNLIYGKLKQTVFEPTKHKSDFSAISEEKQQKANSDKNESERKVLSPIRLEERSKSEQSGSKYLSASDHSAQSSASIPLLFDTQGELLLGGGRSKSSDMFFTPRDPLSSPIPHSQHFGESAFPSSSSPLPLPPPHDGKAKTHSNSRKEQTLSDNGKDKKLTQTRKKATDAKKTQANEDSVRYIEEPYPPEIDGSVITSYFLPQPPLKLKPKGIKSSAEEEVTPSNSGRETLVHNVKGSSMLLHLNEHNNKNHSTNYLTSSQPASTLAQQKFTSQLPQTLLSSSSHQSQSVGSLSPNDTHMNELNSNETDKITYQTNMCANEVKNMKAEHVLPPLFNHSGT